MNLKRLFYIAFSSDYTKSQSSNVAVFESSVQSEQYFQSDARYGQHTSAGVAGELRAQHENAIKLMFFPLTIGTRRTGSRNAETNQRDWEASQDPQSKQLPLYVNSDAKLQQLQSLPRTDKSPGAAPAVDEVTSGTSRDHADSLQEPVEREPEWSLATRPQLLQHSAFSQTHEAVALIDWLAATAADHTSQCDDFGGVQHVQQQQHVEQRAGECAARAKMSNENWWN